MGGESTRRLWRARAAASMRSPPDHRTVSTPIQLAAAHGADGTPAPMVRMRLAVTQQFPRKMARTDPRAIKPVRDAMDALADVAAWGESYANAHQHVVDGAR